MLATDHDFDSRSARCSPDSATPKRKKKNKAPTSAGPFALTSGLDFQHERPTSSPLPPPTDLPRHPHCTPPPHRPLRPRSYLPNPHRTEKPPFYRLYALRGRHLRSRQRRRRL